MGEQKPEKTKKHICAGLLAHVKAGNAVQVIVGVNASFIRGTVNELLDSERSVS